MSSSDLITREKNKIVFTDPLYNKKSPVLAMEKILLDGNWEFEVKDDYNVEQGNTEFLLVLYPDRGTSTKIVFTFLSFTDRVKFIRQFESERYVKQLYTGPDLEEYANQFVLHKELRYDRIVVAASTLVAAGIFLYKKVAQYIKK